MNTLIRLIAIFFIYAFLGYGAEVAYAAVKTGKFVNRGFLNGPICPIYGIGVLAIVLALHPLEHHLLLLFVGAVVLTSTLEFFTGWLLEKIFHARWWDYSSNHFNLKGYICLEFSLIWGFAATAIVRLVHPLIMAGVDRLPLIVVIVLEAIFGVVLIVDLVATLATVFHFRARLRLLCTLADEIHEISDRIGDTISDGVLAVKAKTDEQKEFYADYDALCRLHRSEERELYEKHCVEERQLLDELRAQEPHRTGVRLVADGGELKHKTNELKLKLRETRGKYHRIVAAFPTFHLHTGHAADSELTERLRGREDEDDPTDENNS